MAPTLKPYPEYRDSGVPWLGKIPAHWELRRLKYIVRSIRNSAGARGPDEIYVRLEDIESWTGRLRLPPEFEHFTSSVKRFLPQDVLFGKLRPYLAKVARPECQGVCVSEFLVLRPENGAVLPVFLEQLLRSSPFIHWVSSSTVGAKMPRVEWDDVGNVVVAYPSVDEQEQLTHFLQSLEHRISRFIRAKRRLMGLLNEQKQAVIQRAVTRGLDPNVRLKPSGVDWLGDIPEDWQVRRSKYIYREVDERSASGEEDLLSVSHITGVTPRSLKTVTMFMAESYAGHKLCLPGDLVVNTMWAWMGALGVARQIGIVSPSYAVYRPVRPATVVPSYVDHLLRTNPYVGEYVRRSTGIRSSRMRLYPDKFLVIPIVQPPMEEQHRIAAWIDQHTEAFTSAIVRTQSEIDLIREYRRHLIADAVTGKLDVRGVELPPELDEPQDEWGEPEDVEGEDTAEEVEEAEKVVAVADD